MTFHRTLLHLSDIIQVTISLIIYLHLTFRRTEYCSMAGRVSHIQTSFARYESTTAQCLTGILEGHELDPR